MKSADVGVNPRQRSHRPFDAVVIALSAAMLVIFGIVIGRFVVTTQAVEVVDHFDGELSALRAELVELNRQVLQQQARNVALEESAEQYRRLAQQQQIRAENLAAHQQALRSELAGLTSRREACLGEVQQYVALNQPVPSPDVLRFAEAMFETQAQTLNQLTSAETSSTPLPTVPGFPPVAAATSASVNTGTRVSPTSATAPARTYPALPAPSGRQPVTVSRQVASSNAAQSGVFFAPPQRKRPTGSYTFFAPQRNTQASSMPRNSGITFHDTAGIDQDTARR